MSGKYITDYRQDLRLIKTTPQRTVLFIGVVVSLAVPFILQIDWQPPFDFPWRAWGTAVNLALAWAVGAAAFNLLLGYTGQISIAHAAFLILGSLVGAILGQGAFGLGWSFWIVLPRRRGGGCHDRRPGRPPGVAGPRSVSLHGNDCRPLCSDPPVPQVPACDHQVCRHPVSSAEHPLVVALGAVHPSRRQWRVPDQRRFPLVLGDAADHGLLHHVHDQHPQDAGRPGVCRGAGQ